jgi:hypothetical protein
MNSHFTQPIADWRYIAWISKGKPLNSKRYFGFCHRITERSQPI